jgi:CSLREA domain-containing protein
MVKTTAKTLGVTALALALAVSVVLLLSAPVSRAASITVDSLDDTTVAGDNDCTLREAIANSNSNSDTTSGDCVAGSGADTINFGVTGVITITQGTLRITDDDTTINGDVVGGDGVPDIEVRYSSGGIGDGLIEIASSNNHIEGLAVTNSPGIGVYIDGNGDESDSNLLKNNWIGVDLTGAALGNTSYGVYLWHVTGAGSGATDNVLQGNTLSANGSNGIRVNFAPGTQILSNTVGLNPGGTTAMANSSSGVSLSSDTDTTIQGNTVSGNLGHGIYLTGTQQITITNNIVGLNAAGSLAIPNQSTAGIYIRANVVTADVRGNTVSGNRYNGVFLGSGTTGVVIAGNRIGTDASGTAGLGNGRTTNRDGIQLNDAYGNTIGGPNAADRNIIADNGRTGVFISGEQADNNTVQNNYIGTDVTGAVDLGNGDLGSSSDTGAGGIYIYDGADSNVIQDNLIRYNYIGVRLSGGSTTLVTPPQNNEVLTNTVTTNDKYGIVNQTTHGNTAPYTTPPGGDNLVQNNVISETALGCGWSWCTGIGILNYGASPNIVNNTISENESFGIVNRVYFGIDGPADASDDLLSMPYISGNTISSNGDDGIQSRDTAPKNKATLLDDNTFVNNSGEPHISQRWFVAVEVVTGTETISTGLVITITAQGGGQACPMGDCVGSTFASAGGSDGIWGPSTVSYTDVENESDGTTTWFEVIEYEVNWQGNPVTYTSHLVEVTGDEQGSKAFDFDGITSTQEITGDVNLPFCLTTGILSDSDQSLCRYQIAEIDVFGSIGDGDADNDGIPDEDEGTGDTDGDGTPDYLDDDSDNDGIPDDEEDECTPGVGSGDPCDSDGDGTPDFQDTDSDNDGIPDEEEGSGDTDGDGIPDYRDTDSDGDGIPDDEEDECSPGVGTGEPCDSDGDGTPDYQDFDSDDDGATDNAEGDGDTDGDGIPNYRDDDSDNDGVTDDLDPDDDNDGIPDTDEGFVESSGPDDYDNLDESTDTDGDGLPDYLDPDSDNDGVPDWVEAGCDSQPTDNSTVCPSPDVDSDGDGAPDRLDTDSDNDGTDDGDEWYDEDIGESDKFCTNATVDSDGDTIPNCWDNDVDGDGLDNYQDPDSDGDGTPDSEESHTLPDPSPLSTGIPAWLDPIYRIYTSLLNFSS